jgi:hypothetical protein
MESGWSAAPSSDALTANEQDTLAAAVTSAKPHRPATEQLARYAVCVAEKSFLVCAPKAWLGRAPRAFGG